MLLGRELQRQEDNEKVVLFVVGFGTMAGDVSLSVKVGRGRRYKFYMVCHPYRGLFLEGGACSCLVAERTLSRLLGKEEVRTFRKGGDRSLRNWANFRIVI